MRASIRSLAFLSALLTTTTAMAYEEPKYEIVGQAGELELRRYEAHLVAETTVDGDFDASGSAAFRILARYIFGGNQSKESMAMTIPVTRERLDATGRAATETGAGRWSWTFVMPSKHTLGTLPRPVDARIVLREVPPSLVAVIRFSGRSSTANFREHEEKLRAAMAKAGLTPSGPLRFAVYDAPFKPWFMRRNEILAPIVAPKNGKS